jgi:hypothetical protein
VEFRPEDYGPEIAGILALHGAGRRPMPLVRAESDSTHAAQAIKAFPSLPASVTTGLYLYSGCWDAAHTAADSIEDPNGYFWHAIVHRQEPDASNSGYWFRKVGTHPTFPCLAVEANNLGYHSENEWDPFAFIQTCEIARQHPGSPDEQLAISVQLVEWQLLFDYCARGQSC